MRDERGGFGAAILWEKKFLSRKISFASCHFSRNLRFHLFIWTVTYVLAVPYADTEVIEFEISLRQLHFCLHLLKHRTNSEQSFDFSGCVNHNGFHSPIFFCLPRPDGSGIPWVRSGALFQIKAWCPPLRSAASEHRLREECIQFLLFFFWANNSDTRWHLWLFCAQ